MPLSTTERSQGFWSQLGQNFLDSVDVALSGAAGSIQQHYASTKGTQATPTGQQPTPAAQHSGFNISQDFGGLGTIALVVVVLLLVLKVAFRK